MLRTDLDAVVPVKKEPRAARGRCSGRYRQWRREQTPALGAVLDLSAHLRGEQPAAIDAWPPVQAIGQVILAMGCTPHCDWSAGAAQMNRSAARIPPHLSPIAIADSAQPRATIANHYVAVVTSLLKTHAIPPRIIVQYIHSRATVN